MPSRSPMLAPQAFAYATSQVWQPAVYAHPEAPVEAAVGYQWGQQLARLLLATQGVYVYDHRAKVMCYVSEGVARLTGVAVADFTGERHFALIHPDDLPIVQEATRLFNQFLYAYRRSIGPEVVASVDYRLCLPDGSGRRVLRHNSVLERELETGNPVLVAAILTDITAHKHTHDVRFHLNHPKFAGFVAQQAHPRAQPVLTARERQVMELVTQGLTSRQIAGQLFLSEYTVNTHRRNALAKLASRNLHHLLRHLDPLAS